MDHERFDAHDSVTKTLGTCSGEVKNMDSRQHSWPALAAFGIVIGIVLTPSSASAVEYEYIVPTATYSPACNYGGLEDFTVVCQTDNPAVFYYMYTSGSLAVTDTNRQQIHAAIDSNYRPTDLTFTGDTTPAWTGSAETDFIYRQNPVPDPFVGWTWCDDPVNSAYYKCDQTYIQMEGPAITEGLACHETGHAAGLVHGEHTSSSFGNQDFTHMGCMVKAGVLATTELRDPQKSAINNVY